MKINNYEIPVAEIIILESSDFLMTASLENDPTVDIPIEDNGDL